MKSMAQKTYDKLLNCAVELFDREGYEQTSIDEICRQADVGRSTFYKYFSSKDELAYDLYSEGQIFSPERMAWVLGGATACERFVRIHMCYLRYPTVACGPAVYLAQCRYMVNNAGPDMLSRRYPSEIFVSLAQQAREAGELNYKGDLAVAVSLFTNLQFGQDMAWIIMGQTYDYVSTMTETMRNFYRIPEEIPLWDYIHNSLILEDTNKKK